MKIQIYGCRGSIPRPNPEMSRYGGNTPCIEVVSSKRRACNCNGEDVDHGGGHRIILDLGSGAFDLGQKVLEEMFQQKKRLEETEKKKGDNDTKGSDEMEAQLSVDQLGDGADGETKNEMEELNSTGEAREKQGGGDEQVESTTSSPDHTKQMNKHLKFGGTIILTHTHWDHIQGAPLLLGWICCVYPLKKIDRILETLAMTLTLHLFARNILTFF